MQKGTHKPHTACPTLIIYGPMHAQVRIVPSLYGRWAEEAYGVRPVKVDALSFHTALLEHLKARLDRLRAMGAAAGVSLGQADTQGTQQEQEGEAGEKAGDAFLAGAGAAGGRTVRDVSGQAGAAAAVVAAGQEGAWAEAAAEYLPTAFITFRCVQHVVCVHVSDLSYAYK